MSSAQSRKKPQPMRFQRFHGPRGGKRWRPVSSQERVENEWMEEKIPEISLTQNQSDEMARQHRENGNVYYRRALVGSKQEPSMPNDQQDQLLRDARTLYERALESCHTDVERAKCHKNIGQAYLLSAKLHENPVGVSRQYMTARMAFNKALHSANQCAPEVFDQKWFNQVLSRGNITMTYLDEMMPLLLDKDVLVASAGENDRLEYLMLALRSLPEDVEYLWQAHAVMAQEYLDAALLNAHNDDGVGNAEDRIADGQITLLNLGLESIVQALRINPSPANHGKIEELRKSLQIHLTLAEMNYQLDSAYARFKAIVDAQGESSVENNEVVNAELIDIRQTYQILLYELENHAFLEQEAKVHYHLGKVCAAMGRRRAAFREFSQVVNLAETMDKDMSEVEWVQEAHTWLNDENKRRQEQSNVNDRVYTEEEVETFKTKLTILRKDGSLQNFVDYLWEHLPPKNGNPKPAKDDVENETEDVLDDILQSYHAGNDAAKEWRVICEAVKNCVNGFVNDLGRARREGDGMTRMGPQF